MVWPGISVGCVTTSVFSLFTKVERSPGINLAVPRYKYEELHAPLTDDPDKNHAVTNVHLPDVSGRDGKTCVKIPFKHQTSTIGGMRSGVATTFTKDVFG